MRAGRVRERFTGRTADVGSTSGVRVVAATCFFDETSVVTTIGRAA